MSGFTTLMVGLAMFFTVFLVCREIMCWYTKRNETLEILRNIDANLAELVMKRRKNG